MSFRVMALVTFVLSWILPVGARAALVCQQGCLLDNDCDGVLDVDELLVGTSAATCDTDGDNISDGDEVYYLLLFAPDVDGDGTVDALDTDSDNDGISDFDESGCENTCSVPANSDGDDQANYRDSDSDDDGTPDSVEAGDDDPTTPPRDSDHDGTPDFIDSDSDNDGTPDDVEGTDDVDGDGIPGFIDFVDNDGPAGDYDGDGFANGDLTSLDDNCRGGVVSACADNCANVANPDQADADNDGIGAACDADDTEVDTVADVDGDSAADGADNCPLVANPDQVDSDADGVGDACDTPVPDTDEDLDTDGALAGFLAGGGPANCASTAIDLWLFVAIGALIWLRRRFAALLVVAVLSVAGTASAQGVDLGSRQTLLFSRGASIVPQSDALPFLGVDVTAGYDYAHKPLVMQDADGRDVGALVDGQGMIILQGRLGLVKGFELAVELPAVVHREAGPMASGNGETNAGLGDVQAGVRYTILKPRQAPVGVAAFASLSIPTGDGTAYLGTGDPGGSLGAIVELPTRIVRLAALGAYRIRTGERVDGEKAPDQLAYYLGAELPLAERLALMGRVGGTVGLGPERNERALEAAVGVRVPVGVLDAFVAGGAGLTDAAGSAAFHVGAGVAYAFVRADKHEAPPVYVAPPEPVKTEREAPPAETREALVEPAPAPAAPIVVAVADTDNDGLTDDKDACPSEPETANDFRDDDGCPDDKPEVVFEKQSTVVFNDIRFVSRSDVILRESYALLDSIARSLRQQSTVVVRIEGHTDGRGDSDRNLRLSQMRALAVMNYLLERGVEAERLSYSGYGATRPVASNSTNDGRAKNRRVEFLVLGK